jgi:hypothetical protein
VNNFEKNYKALYENYGSLKFFRRVFYPRNLKLSEEFVNSFKKEYKRLAEEGHNTKSILEKISKALIFHSKK